MNYPTLTLSLFLEFLVKLSIPDTCTENVTVKLKTFDVLLFTDTQERQRWDHFIKSICSQNSQQRPYLRLLSWFEHIKCWNNTINELPRAATTDRVLSLLLSFFHSHISLRSCLSLSLPSEPNQNHTGKCLSNLLLNIVYNPWPPSSSLVIISTRNFARTKVISESTFTFGEHINSVFNCFFQRKIVATFVPSYFLKIG